MLTRSKSSAGRRARGLGIPHSARATAISRRRLRVPDATASAAPAGSFDFDSLLAPNPSPSSSSSSNLSPSPSPSRTAATSVAPAPRVIAQEAQPGWHDFASSWALYRDPIVCGVVAGAVLGVLGVFVVLRRAVFVTSAVSQSAALGVALAFLFGIYLGFTPPPVLCAFVLALASTGVLAL